MALSGVRQTGASSTVRLTASAALVIGILMQPLWEAPSALQEILLCAVLLAIVLAVATHRDDPAQSSSARAGSEVTRLVVRTLVHLIFLKYDRIFGSTLLKAFSIAVLPLLTALDADFGLPFQVFSVVHFLLTGASFIGDLSGEGWRWLMILAGMDVVLWDLCSSRKVKQEGHSVLKMISGLLHDLLGTMTDGYLLLNDGELIMDASEAAADLLDLSPDLGAQDPIIAPESVASLFEADGNVQNGLRTLRLSANNRKFVVETYTVPLPLPQELIPLLMAHSNSAKSSRAADIPIYLCTMRIMQQESTTPTAAASGREGSLGNAKPPSLAPSEMSMGTLQPAAFGSSARQPARGPASMVSAAPLSPRGSVISAAAPGGVQGALPGTSWQHNSQASVLGMGSYSKVRIVGRGGQGVVWQVKDQDGIFYAQKEINLKGILWHIDFPKRLRDADREVRALKGLAWARAVIVPIIDCWIQNDFEQACIVMEWFPHNLEKVLKQRQKQHTGPVALPDLSCWMAHMTCGVAAIHCAGFIHRDLKPSNILLDEQLTLCKIADLGVSRPLHRARAGEPATVGLWGTTESADPDDEKMSMVSRSSFEGGAAKSMVSQARSILSGYTVRPGTNAYSSPEALTAGNYGCSVDVFSLGCILFEMLTQEILADPKLGEDESSVPEHAMQVLAPSIARGGELAELQLVCTQMLGRKPQDRPRIQEVAACKALQPEVEALSKTCARLREALVRDSDL